MNFDVGRHGWFLRMGGDIVASPASISPQRPEPENENPVFENTGPGIKPDVQPAQDF